MSDFIVSFNKQLKSSDLLALLKKPYVEQAPGGRTFNFPWGNIAVLDEHLANNNNVIERDGILLIWVGDLVTKLSGDYSDKLINRILALMKEFNNNICLQSDSVFEQLNGAFVILLASHTGFSIVTDLMGSVPVYLATDATNNVVSFSTHSDLAAAVSQNLCSYDIISVTEFLDSGHCTFPYTMYSNVRELGPGRVHVIGIGEDNAVTMVDYLYWEPPEEIWTEVDEDSLFDQLRNAVLLAVRSRCNVTKVGVLLSGGSDSRLVLAATPSDVECECLTFSNNPNRETRTASQVAKCHGRSWLPFYRDTEFLAKFIIDAVLLIGCEFDCLEAQDIGFRKQIAEQNIKSLLTGFLFDMYLKGYYADDWVRIKRMFGILPSVYHKVEYSNIDGASDFLREHIPSDIVEEVVDRRRAFHEKFDFERSSAAEWLKLYPFSQDSMGYWASGRRVLPLRLVGADRRLLDFAFSCPLRLKLKRTVFKRVIKDICVKSMHIPRANDGVRPGSGHWWRFAQRAVRKFQDGTVHFLEKLGKESQIQHSWHDYQKYWRESEKLCKLIYEYSANLDQFDGILFKNSGRALLESKEIDWHYGFRLLQLAVWLSIKKNYALVS